MEKKKLGSIIRFIVFLGLGMGILYYVYYTTNQQYQLELQDKGLPAQDYLVKLGNDMANANYFWIGLVILAFLASNISRAIRWKMLLDPLKMEQDGTKVKLHNPLMAVLVGYVMNLVIPRAGEVAKCGVINQYEKISIDKVLGTAVLDRILDVICLFLMILLALALEFDTLWGYLSENVFESADGGGFSIPIWLWILGGFGISALVLFIIFRKKLEQFAIYKKIEGLVIGFVEGLRAIQKLENPLAFIGHTLFIWLMYYLMLYFAFFSFGPTAHLAAVAGLLVFVFGALGMVIPSPGGIGSYQYLVSTALVTFYAIGGSDALSFANIAFTAPFLCNIIFGIIAFVLLPVLNRKKT
jgi:uncharacterized protein (TIRG00374 family)